MIRGLIAAQGITDIIPNSRYLLRLTSFIGVEEILSFDAGFLH